MWDIKKASISKREDNKQCGLTIDGGSVYTLMGNEKIGWIGKVGPMMKNLESQTEKLGLEFEGHKKALWALELRSNNVKIVAIVVRRSLMRS